MALQTKDYSVSGKSKSGINYTFIIRVTENSIDVATNSSNVTVQAILISSYDGLTFYNVGIGISCFLNAERVIYENEWRRCEGTGEHVYETWTGDITHDEEGNLSLVVGGQLWTSGTANFLPPTMTIEEVESDAMVLTQIIANSPPLPPSALMAPEMVAGGDPVNVCWNEAEDPDGNVNGYELERSINGGETFEQVYIGDGTDWTDTAPEAGSIAYRVRAVDVAGLYSEWSELCQVAINSAPQLSEDAAFGVFSDEAHKIPVSMFSLGQTLYLQVGTWTDPDGNLAGGQLLIQQRVKSPAGVVGDWEELLAAEMAEDGLISCTVEPEQAAYLGSIQFRATVADALGAVRPEWLESGWILRKDVPQVIVGQSWHRPTIGGANVMPYVRINGRWVRHGGEYQQPGTNPAETSILGVGVLGVMILGKEG